MAITQNQLASHLGLSRQSVVRALHGHGEISEQTRQRVLQAARELGYTQHSNQEARALIARRYGKRLRHDLIAVMMWNSEGGSIRDSPYFTPLFQGIEEEARVRGVDVALHTFVINHLPKYVLEKRVDGVIGFATTPERTQGLYEDGVPMLTIGSDQEYASSVRPDDYQGIRLTTQHLIDLGHRRIAYLGYSVSSKERVRAFRDTMAENGLPIDENIVEATILQPTELAGHAGMQTLCERSTDFTALVCHNDTIAIGAIEHLRSLGLEVPRDVSVTGFDDISPDYQFHPALTSVFFDRHAMGRRAVAVFYEILDEVQVSGPNCPLPIRREVFPVELVVRDSTREIGR